MKLKNIFIGIIISILVFGTMAFGFWLTMSESKTNPSGIGQADVELKPNDESSIYTIVTETEKDIDKELLNLGLTKEVIQTMTAADKIREIYPEEDAEYILTSVYLDHGKKEYEAGADALSTIKQDYLSANYTNIYQKNKQILIDYNFTNLENTEILGLLMDASLMQSYDSVKDADKLKLLQSHSNPFSFMVDMLYSDPYKKVGNVIDIGSIVPMVSSKAVLLNELTHSKGSDLVLQYANSVSNLRNVYEYELEVHMEIYERAAVVNIKALVAETNAHKFKLIGFYEVDGSEEFKTVQYWKSLKGGIEND